MGIFLGILIGYFSLGYAALRYEINGGVSGQTPLVRDRQYLLYLLIWPLPLLANNGLQTRMFDKEVKHYLTSKRRKLFELTEVILVMGK